MARNFPATILGMVAGAGVSIASGALLGSYVVSGVTPAYAEAAPPRIRAEPVTADEDTWPAPDYMAAVSQPVDPDQDAGVLASGSSRL